MRAAASVLLRIVLSLTAVFFAAGCARFQDQTLEAGRTAAQLEARSLADTGLRAFLQTNLQTELSPWPLALWDLKLLTLAALYYQPSLDLARAQWETAQAKVITAGGRPNPSVSVVPEYNANPAGGVTPWLPAVNFDIPIETAGKRGHRLAAARQLAESARLALASAAWQVRSRLRASLLDFAVAGRRAAQFEKQLALQQEILKRLEQRLTAGAVAAPEVTPMRIALSKTRLELGDAEAKRVEARARVAEAVGVPVSALAGVNLTFDLDRLAPDDLNSVEVRRVALPRR